jgi:hypothetical protein
MPILAFTDSGDPVNLFACVLLAPITYFLAFCALALALHPRGKRPIVWLLGGVAILGCVILIAGLRENLAHLAITFLAGPAVLALCAMGLSLLIPRQRFPDRRSVARINDISRLWAQQVNRQQPFVHEPRRAA